MTIRFINAFLILGLILGFSSCGTYYYYPTAQNVLKFKEKGDGYLAVRSDGRYSGVNLGYSITDNIGLISDYKESNGSPAFLWDNELVIYKKINHFYPAVNLGYSYGRINNSDGGLKVNIHRQFIQPSLGFSNKFFDIALSSRISRVHYNVEKLRDINLPRNYTFERYYNLQDVGKKDFYFFEPAVTIGVGYDIIKFRLQWVFVNKIPSGNISYYDKSINLTLNLAFNINEMFIRNDK